MYHTEPTSEGTANIMKEVAQAIANKRWRTKTPGSLVYSEQLAKAAIKAHSKALEAEGLMIVSAATIS